MCRSRNKGLIYRFLNETYYVLSLGLFLNYLRDILKVVEFIVDKDLHALNTHRTEVEYYSTVKHCM